MSKSYHGEQTGEFGVWLTDYFNASGHYQDLTVYYDHGDRDEYPNVAAVKGFYGDHVAHRNRLADIDVMVAKDDEVLLLIEIEESEMSPKKILGDVFAILFCNQVGVRINGKPKDFSISPKTELIVAGIVPRLGDRREKIEDVITPRLQQFSVPDDCIQIEKIGFVYGESISELLCKLKCKVESLFPEEIS
jgi:hypothetical protein